VRLAVLLAAVAAAFAIWVAPAGATSECRGLMVCVPVVGPWVVVPTAASAPRPSVDYLLTCPRGWIVGGLDAELSARGLDVQFHALLGSPVNPGISTSRTALFTATLAVGSTRAPTFRPHIGCIPTAGGGARVPTALRVFPVGRPTTMRAKEVRLRPGTALVSQACKSGETLVGGSHAVAFYTVTPPAAALAESVTATRTIRPGAVAVAVQAGRAVRAVRAVVQAVAVCAGGS
jgi:hypothetical protein